MKLTEWIEGPIAQGGSFLTHYLSSQLAHNLSGSEHGGVDRDVIVFVILSPHQRHPLAEPFVPPSSCSWCITWPNCFM